MAYTGYGAKYTLSFSDSFQTDPGQYVATIYKKGYTDELIEISGGASPIVIETDSSGDAGYRPFIATKASLNLIIRDSDLPRNWDDITDNWDLYTQIWNQTGFNFTEFITAGIDTFLLEVKRKTGVDTYQIIWQGYYIYNTDVSISEITPIQLTLQFSDTLLMKVNRYYNFPVEDQNLVRYDAGDYISIEDVIMRCCYFAKITNTVILEFPYTMSNSYKTLSGGTEYSGVFGTIQKNAFLKSLGKYHTCYDILSGICSQFGLIAYFNNNKIYIKSYENLMNQTTRFVTEYELGTYDEINDYVSYTEVDNYTETDSIQYLNASDSFKNLGRDQTIKFNYPVNDVSVENKSALAFNTPNYTMSSVSQYAPSALGGTVAILNSWYSTIGGAFPEGRELRFSLTDTLPVAAAIPIRPFYPYCTIKTQTEGIVFATKLVGKNALGFNLDYYIESEPFDVSSGDWFSLSYSAFTDGRLKNLPTSGGGYTQSTARPRPVVALVLIAKDDESNDVTYFYNSTTGKFESTNIPTGAGSLPLITTTNYGGSDSDRISIDIKGVLDIPNNAKLRVRQYQPYRLSDYPNAPDSVQLYVQYCNLQVFKGTNVQGLPTGQQYTATFGNIINSDESISLNSNLFMMDATRYTPDAAPIYGQSKTKNPMYVPSCYSNTVVDGFFNPLSGIEIDYANPYCTNVSYETLQTKLTSITSSILRNIGLNNVTIDGTYISDGVYFIGTKFRYEIIGYYEVDFVMMDYKIDLKNRTYNALLYSSLFTPSSIDDVTTRTLIS